MSKFIISGFADEIDPNFDVQMEHLKKLGISYFEIRGVDGKNISTLTDEEVKNVKNKIDKMGIKVSAIGSPIGKDKIDENFEPQIQRFERVVKIAKMLDTKYIRIFSYFCKNEECEQIKDEVIKRLSTFVKIAEKENVILLHENEKDIFGEQDIYCKYLFDNIKSPNFKGIFDPANFVQSGVDTLKAFELLKEHIVYMHIKDAKEDGNVVPAGYGIGNVKEILSQLNDKNYEGFVSLEPHLGNFVGFAELETDNTKMAGDAGPDKFTLAFNKLTDILKEF